MSIHINEKNPVSHDPKKDLKAVHPLTNSGTHSKVDEKKPSPQDSKKIQAPPHPLPRSGSHSKVDKKKPSSHDTQKKDLKAPHTPPNSSTLSKVDKKNPSPHNKSKKIHAPPHAPLSSDTHSRVSEKKPSHDLKKDPKVAIVPPSSGSHSKVGEEKPSSHAPKNPKIDHTLSSHSVDKKNPASHEQKDTKAGHVPPSSGTRSKIEISSADGKNLASQDPDAPLKLGRKGKGKANADVSPDKLSTQSKVDGKKPASQDPKKHPKTAHTPPSSNTRSKVWISTIDGVKLASGDPNSPLKVARKAERKRKKRESKAKKLGMTVEQLEIYQAKKHKASKDLLKAPKTQEEPKGEESKKKQPKEKKPKGKLFFEKDISTKRLRDPSFQKQAMVAALRADSSKKDTDFISSNAEEQVNNSFFNQQDHLLELQAVTYHMNKHKPTDLPKCFQRLRSTLNSENNRYLITKKTNLQKGIAMKALLHGKPTKHFTPEVQAHIIKHKQMVMDNTGDKVDIILRKEECGKMPPGLKSHAEHMANIAGVAGNL